MELHEKDLDLAVVHRFSDLATILELREDLSLSQRNVLHVIVEDFHRCMLTLMRADRLVQIPLLMERLRKIHSAILIFQPQHTPGTEHLPGQVQPLQNAAVVDDAVLQSAVTDGDILKDHAVSKVASGHGAAAADANASV